MFNKITALAAAVWAKARLPGS